MPTKTKTEDFFKVGKNNIGMKIPKQLKIGGHIYKIKLVRNNGLDQNECGKLISDKNELVLDVSMPVDQVEETLIHEIFHGINGVISHELLDSLANQFHQVLRDNKMLK